MPSEQLRRLKQMLSVRKKDQFELESFRSDFERFASLFPPPKGVSFEPAVVGGVAAEWAAAPGASAAHAVVYLHGGGYVSGSLATHRELCGRLSVATGALVLAVDYRRAPESPFPAAFEDSLAAYRGLIAAGAAPERVALAGDSAGGGLVLAVLQALAVAREPRPAAAVLLSPWVDVSPEGERFAGREAEDPILHPVILRSTAGLYLAGADPLDPRVSPIFGQLTGLPPTVLQVGTAEILLEQSRTLAAALTAAGVEVSFSEWPELVHAAALYASLIPEGEQVVAQAGSFLRRHLGLGVGPS